MGFYPNMSGLDVGGMLALGMQLAEKKKAREAEQATLKLALDKHQREQEKEALSQARNFAHTIDDETYPQFRRFIETRASSYASMVPDVETWIKMPDAQKKTWKARFAKGTDWEQKPWEPLGRDEQLEFVKDKARATKTAEAQVEAEFPGKAYKPGETKEFKVGDEVVTKEYQADGTWKTVAEAPRYKPSATNIDVDVGDKGMSKLAEEMGKTIAGAQADVEGAAQGLQNIYEVEQLLDDGMITGTGAKFLTGLGSFLSSRLGITYFEDPVANTQAYAAAIGKQVGQIIKQFGAGTGLSDADREYAERIVAGDITLTEPTLRKLIEINKRAYKNVIKTYNKKAEQVMGAPGSEGLPYDLRVDMPESPKKETHPLDKYFE